jgi:hypothetical protein
MDDAPRLRLRRGVRRPLHALVLAVALLGAACAQPPTGEWTATRLIFGLSMPDGGQLDAAAWNDFVETVVAPRFPDGFTVLDGRGRWRDPKSGAVAREDSKVLLILHPGGADAARRIDAIVEAYKRRFRQRSVLRWESPADVRF